MHDLITPNRRRFLAFGTAAAALSLAGCAKTPRQQPISPMMAYERDFPPDIVRMYGPVLDEPFPLPMVNLRRLNPIYWRQVVADPTGERPGTIVVDTANRFLYLVLEGGQAMRYGVGIGREGFAWSGKGYIGRKAEWPTWTPPAEMIKREPELAEFANGMPPGPENPLGARALYIYTDGRDTLYRLHGNPDETSIGQAVSSGCVRLLQQDIIDLYKRVPVGADVVVWN